MNTKIILQFLLCLAASYLAAQNPVIRNIYTADPSARVFNDTLFIYPSHDGDNARWWDMEDWPVYSTTDMVNFHDHGICFSLKDISWAEKYAWAPDCVEKNGKYYFYYPVDQKHIGVAVGDRPEGPFKDPLGKPLLSIDTPGVICNRDFIDPCVFIDDDGSVYMFVGQNDINVIKLNEDMISWSGEVMHIQGADDFFEAVWVHKYKNKYYLSYSGRGKILYGMSDNLLGPYAYKGEILDEVNSGTNHHSIVQYKGQWYLFYHTADLALQNIPPESPDREYIQWRRSVCFDKLYYNEDGTIRKVIPTKSESMEWEKDENWWGCYTWDGSIMPYSAFEEMDLGKNNKANQVMPLLVSDRGRYIWSDDPFAIESDGSRFHITYSGELKTGKAGNTLKEAYRYVSKKFFPPSGKLPDKLLFTAPQYNTWIELTHNQNQEDILRYAEKIVESGFPPGVLMIDAGWANYYGNFEFKADRFSDPRGMIKQLHDRGFKVMLWVSPFVSPDSPEFRQLQEKGWLIKNNSETDAGIVRWWDGFSAVFDLTNPDCYSFLVNQLKEMQVKYDIDGFKLDGGDLEYYPSDFKSFMENARPTDHLMKWMEIGLNFPLNEYRASWKAAGLPLVQRLADKHYKWNAVEKLIPEMTALGLMGQPFSCPDMIGGGEYLSFRGVKPEEFDQELIVRSAQVHAMMPMMQFSVAPWRILSPENLRICVNMAKLHEEMSPYIIQLAEEASRTGEPIVRNMEYEFPHQGFSHCKDQFMLGDKYMVAPMVHAGKERSVLLPPGKWKDDQGKVWKGGKKIHIDVPLERLPYFVSISEK